MTRRYKSKEATKSVRCPECQSASRVLKTRLNDTGNTVRDRICSRGHRFRTTEIAVAPRPPSVRKKISAALTGRKHTPAHRAKIRAAMRERANRDNA